MKCFLVAALAPLCMMPYAISQIGVARPHANSALGAVDATQFPGLDGCAKINAAVASLPPQGGIVDATGFDSPQIVSTTCVTTPNPTGTQIVEINFNPATSWVPAIPSMSVLSVNRKSIVRGMHIDASGVAGYSGSAIIFDTYNVGDTDYTALEDTQIDLPWGSGIGIYISPSETGAGYSGLNITGLRIYNGLVGISMVSGPTYMQFLNGNNISNFWIKNAVTCISLDGTAQTTAQTWLSALAANHFTNGSCQHGPSTIYTIVVKNASDNNFSNVTTWDGGTTYGDATSNYNYWTGFGASVVQNWLGVGNNYTDPHGDSFSVTGMHQFRYPGGADFIGPKVQLENGSDAVQFLPGSYGGYPAFQVSGGGADNTYIGPNKINTDEYDQSGSPEQSGPGSGGSSGSGTDPLVPTPNGLQVNEGGLDNIYLSGDSVNFQNGSTFWKLQESPAGINVVQLGCCNSTYLDGNKISTSEYDVYNGQTAKVLISSLSPTISSGFGTGASIGQSNGSSSFTITIGPGGNAMSGVLNLSPTLDSWNCWCNDRTTTSSAVFMCKQTASSSTLVTLANFDFEGRPEPWQAGDTISVSCFAN
ncbi:MAG: hypothetical protein WBC92_09530 [Terracidiphilus sp.]